MNITAVQLTELRPTEGHWITSKSVDTEPNRFFSDFIILAQNDSVDNYEEWSDSQKLEWEDTYLYQDPEAGQTD